MAPNLEVFLYGKGGEVETKLCVGIVFLSQSGFGKRPSIVSLGEQTELH